MVDKYEAKNGLLIKSGGDVIPTLGVWDSFDDIDFDKLPNQFVLKCTHDSGGLVICRDKTKLDKSSVRAKIEKCLKHNFFWGQREWPYKNVKPRIIAENIWRTQLQKRWVVMALQITNSFASMERLNLYMFLAA